METCLLCGKFPTDRAHIKSKGSGGGMEPENLLSLCRFHHSLQHSQGWAKMTELYPKLTLILKEKGWELRNEFGIKRLRRIT